MRCASRSRPWPCLCSTRCGTPFTCSRWAGGAARARGGRGTVVGCRRKRPQQPRGRDGRRLLRAGASAFGPRPRAGGGGPPGRQNPPKQALAPPERTNPRSSIPHPSPIPYTLPKTPSPLKKYFSILVWVVGDAYWTYAVCIFVITWFSIVTSAVEAHNNMRRLADIAYFETEARACWVGSSLLPPVPASPVVASSCLAASRLTLFLHVVLRPSCCSVLLSFLGLLSQQLFARNHPGSRSPERPWTAPPRRGRLHTKTNICTQNAPAPKGRGPPPRPLHAAALPRPRPRRRRRRRPGRAVLRLRAAEGGGDRGREHADRRVGARAQGGAPALGEGGRGRGCPASPRVWGASAGPPRRQRHRQAARGTEANQAPPAKPAKPEEARVQDQKQASKSKTD
jgi:hypothetical protein